MSQFAPPPQGDFAAPVQQPPRTSKLAVSALVCSLIFCCPLTTILGVLLGLAGVAVTGSTSALRGRGMAVVGLILGLVFTGVQFLGGNYVYQNFVEPVMTGPAAAMEAGFTGDTAGFRSHFTGKGAGASDEEAQAFLDELTARYGDYSAIHFDQARGNQQQTQPGRGTFPYMLAFSNDSVEAEAELIFADQATGQIVMKWSYIEILDEEKGDLRYPPEDADGDG